jgi:hypothetical protein
MGERANRLEAQCHPDRWGVDVAGMWEESHASYPERSAVLPLGYGRHKTVGRDGRSQPRP